MTILVEILNSVPTVRCSHHLMQCGRSCSDVEQPTEDVQTGGTDDLNLDKTQQADPEQPGVVTGEPLASSEAPQQQDIKNGKWKLVDTTSSGIKSGTIDISGGGDSAPMLVLSLEVTKLCCMFGTEAHAAPVPMTRVANETDDTGPMSLKPWPEYTARDCNQIPLELTLIHADTMHVFRQDLKNKHFMSFDRVV